MDLVLILVIPFVIGAVGAVIGLVRREWVSYYVVAIGVVIAAPIVLIVKLVHSAISVAVGLWRLLVVPALKTVIYALAVAGISVVVIVTLPVQYVGKIVQSAGESLSSVGISSDTTAEYQYARHMLVEVKAEIDTHSLEYNEEDEYREQLHQTKEKGKQKLSTGESILSFSVGSLLLISQVRGLELFRTGIYGLRLSTAIQFLLLLIGVSVIYRVAMLDALAFGRHEPFNSLPEMDIALSYQKAISTFPIFQILNIMIPLAIIVSDVDYEIVRPVLENHYTEDTSIIDTVRFAWEKLQQD